MPRPATPSASAPGPTPRVAPPLAAAPRFAALWAAGVYAVGTAWLGYPAFLGQFLVSPVSDQYIGGYAVREFGTTVLRQTGHWPLWNPYLFGGMPYIAAMNGDIFYPTFLLRLVLPADVAVTWAFMIHIFLAGWLTYLFLRVAGVGFWGALAGGLAYMMGGPIASYVSPGHDGKLYVSALFPLALLLITRGVRDGRTNAWPLLALTVGLGILTPHPQLMQYMLIGGGAYAVYLALWSGEAVTQNRRTAIRRLGAALGSVALGLSMGAIQFLPVAQYVAYSPRAGGGMAGRDPYDFAASYSMPPEELINTYLPQFSGLLDNYWGRTGIHFQSEYLGAAVLCARRLRTRRESRRAPPRRAILASGRACRHAVVDRRIHAVLSARVRPRSGDALFPRASCVFLPHRLCGRRARGYRRRERPRAACERAVRGRLGRWWRRSWRCWRRPARSRHSPKESRHRRHWTAWPTTRRHSPPER